jgi:hypothetical protein
MKRYNVFELESRKLLFTAELAEVGKILRLHREAMKRIEIETEGQKGFCNLYGCQAISSAGRENYSVTLVESH